MSTYAYYVEKAEEMLSLAERAREPDAKREFERLAEEYRRLAEAAKREPKHA